MIYLNVIFAFLLFLNGNILDQDIFIKLIIVIIESRVNDYLKKYLEQIMEEEDVETFLFFLVIVKCLIY